MQAGTHTHTHTHTERHVITASILQLFLTVTQNQTIIRCQILFVTSYRYQNVTRQNFKRITFIGSSVMSQNFPNSTILHTCFIWYHNLFILHTWITNRKYNMFFYVLPKHNTLVPILTQETTKDVTYLSPSSVNLTNTLIIPQLLIGRLYILTFYFRAIFVHFLYRFYITVTRKYFYLRHGSVQTVTMTITFMHFIIWYTFVIITIKLWFYAPGSCD